MMFHAHSTGYEANRLVFLSWSTPFRYDDDSVRMEYEIYRDNELIADTEQKINTESFSHLTRFDQDKHTNLFRKYSDREYWYVDSDVKKYNFYSYKIIMKCYKDDELILEDTAEIPKIEVQ